ncbi:MAG: calcium/sodium antiporter [Anaerolineae bacterium]|nr:calcium/sodium antiporter [Anaerolineae bacterium]
MNVGTLILFVVGLGLLVVGAEALVRGASRLATAVGISPLVIGLTVVAYGTSAPEMAVSVQSALSGQADIAVGNVIGSNIFNVLFILGAAALITPLIVSGQLIRRDVPLMIAISVGLLLLGLDGRLGRLDGILLLLGIIIYTTWSIWQSRRENQQIKAEFAQEFGQNPPHGPGQITLQIIYILVGLGLLVLGSTWLVDGAVAIAALLGVSQLVIGLTIVAAGTSLPEVATSIVASIRGERDIAVGNVVGSNIFNILSVLGLAAIVSPQPILISPAALSFDIPVMIAVAIICLPIFFTGGVIARWEGGLFLGYYLAYTVYLVLTATQPHLVPEFRTVMLAGVIPLTGLVLLISLFRSFNILGGLAPTSRKPEP